MNIPSRIGFLMSRTARPLIRMASSKESSPDQVSAKDEPKTNKDGQPILQFTFAAASGQFFYIKEDVKQVDIGASFSGSFGILPIHVPTLAVLKPGLVTVFEHDGSVKKYFCSSGTVTVNRNSTCQIVAEEAHPLDCFDKNVAKQILSEAEGRVKSASDEKLKAEAQIEVEAMQEMVRVMDEAGM